MGRDLVTSRGVMHLALPFLVALGGCGGGGAAASGGTTGGSVGQAGRGGGTAGGGAAGVGGFGGLAAAGGAAAGGAAAVGGATAAGGAAATGGAGAAGGIGGDPNAAGVRPLRLLTQREYLNTVRDLSGADVTLGPLGAESEDPDSGFAFHVTGTVTQDDLLQFQAAAEQLAQVLVGKISEWLPCAATASDPATQGSCVAAFLAPSGFATKIFRRPLSTEDTTGEVARLTALYNGALRAQLSLDFAGAMGVVVEAMLQSPEFLYHWQVEDVPSVIEDGVVKLGDYELANRLSYLLWGTMPDDQLFAAAAAGTLGDVAGVEAQARRMLADDRAADAVGNFFTDWLDIDTLPVAAKKDPAVYPGYDAGLVAATMQEVARFTSTIVLAGSGRYDQILTSTSSFADAELASLYGVSGVTGSDLSPVSLPAAQRSGLFTEAAFLALTGAADGSDPPRRGKAIYEKLLCGTLPMPAPIMPPVAPATPGGPTTRQRFAAADSPGCAASCHSIIDPLGFAFEHYDGIGAYRALDNGAAVNASAIVTLDGRSTAVADARGLMAALVTSDEAQTCFVTQWLRYALGRPETPADEASLETAESAFKANMRNIRELLVAVATSRTFRYRTPGRGEVLP